MHSKDTYKEFWKYLTQTQKDLILEGQHLMNNIIKDNTYHFKDYSFLIFPYAKSYEGFLKKIFYDIRFITHTDYISNHLRIGKIMSPNLIGRLRNKSMYKKVRDSAGEELARKIWLTWKVGRNQIFHYFPDNNKAPTFKEAEDIITMIVKTMEETFEKLYLKH